MASLWSICISTLEAELAEQEFNTWVRPLQAIEGEGVLKLLAPNRFAVEWVRLPDANIGYLVGDWLTMGMLLTLPMILAGVIVMLYAYRRAQPSGNLVAAKA